MPSFYLTSNFSQVMSWASVSDSVSSGVGVSYVALVNGRRFGPLQSPKLAITSLEMDLGPYQEVELALAAVTKWSSSAPVKK